VDDEETARVREIIERELKVEGDLRREISMNVKRLMDIGGLSRHPPSQGACPCAASARTPTRGPQGPRKGVMVKKKPDGGGRRAPPRRARRQGA
jgi:small subunit ribosomal protein S13